MRSTLLFFALLMQAVLVKANINFLVLKSLSSSPNNIPSTVISKFYGEMQYGAATMYWSAYEQGVSSKFIIERSENGKDFKVLDSLKSNTVFNFQYKDTLPFPTGFYRIKAIQADTIYSEVIRLSSLSGMPEINVLPEVFDALITVELNSKINEEFAISLANSKGKILSSRLVSAEKGANKIIFDDGISFLYADEYTVSITAVKYFYSKKLYKK